MRITESQLRKIIRNELINEGVMSEELKQAAKAALMTLGITLTPTAIISMATSIQDAVNSADIKGAHNKYIDKSGDKIDKLNRTMHYKTSHHPTLSKGSEQRKNNAISNKIEDLKNQGYTDEEIEKLLKLSDSPEMYEG